MSIVNSLESVQRAIRQGKKSPYKVLLLLIALKHYKDKEVRWLSFEIDIVPQLTSLLLLVGVPIPRPEYPFWRTQKDGIWVVRTDGRVTVNSSGDVSKQELIRLNASGSLSLSLYNKYIDNIVEYSTISSALINNMLDLTPEVEAQLREILDINNSSVNNSHKKIGVEVECLLDEIMAF